MKKTSSLPFDPADLAKEASLLPPLPEDNQDEFSELRIMLIGIEEEDLLDVLTNHEITAETIPFVTEKDLKRMNIANASEISKKLEVFREEKHRELSENKKLLFGEFSTTFTESDKNIIAANSTEHLKYLAGTVTMISFRMKTRSAKNKTKATLAPKDKNRPARKTAKTALPNPAAPPLRLTRRTAKNMKLNQGSQNEMKTKRKPMKKTMDENAPAIIEIPSPSEENKNPLVSDLDKAECSAAEILQSANNNDKDESRQSSWIEPPSIFPNDVWEFLADDFEFPNPQL
ncbi:Oidioi.mRNA.OKI2018_I69.chr1.g2518.t1.cds [Oikopleura dioica]|uniref:Oidioi.mRNA.OKI2018_I69.chr1.g2518.t1.cds n=1 Tax=Oikopleura dioica TaxID=34765 RepID=A0ABN7SWQ2_OIKDI|nr:Oidioi.mRNA.OKI2018_I69.chr1.g2518.t1.cds [Oikopleura dioica]